MGIPGENQRNAGNQSRVKKQTTPGAGSSGSWTSGQTTALSRPSTPSEEPASVKQRHGRRDFPGGPVAKNPPSHAGDEGSIPGLGTRPARDSY